MYILLRWLEWIKQPHKDFMIPGFCICLDPGVTLGISPLHSPSPNSSIFTHKITKPYENKPTGFLFVMHLVKELQQPGLCSSWWPSETQHKPVWLLCIYTSTIKRTEQTWWRAKVGRINPTYSSKHCSAHYHSYERKAISTLTENILNHTKIIRQNYRKHKVLKWHHEGRRQEQT